MADGFDWLGQLGLGGGGGGLLGMNTIVPGDWNDRLAQNRASLIGLGLGMASPSLTKTPMENALAGYEQGAKTDEAGARTRAQQQIAAQHLKFQQDQAAENLRRFNLPSYQYNQGDLLTPDKFIESRPGQIPRILSPPSTSVPVTSSPAAPPAPAPSPFDTGGTAPVPTYPSLPASAAPARRQTMLPDLVTSAQAADSGIGQYQQVPQPGTPSATPGWSMQPPTAAPPMATPTAAAPAPSTGRNEAYLNSLPTDGARTLVKGVAEYDIDPNQLDAKHRAQVLAAAKTYRPDYSSAGYQNRVNPPGGEVAARMGLANYYLDRFPAIEQRLIAGELTDPQGKAQAYVGQGGPGELRRAIDKGAEALERAMTGMGMPATEASNYARQYSYDYRDTRDTAVRKVRELNSALRYINTKVGEGRGGENLLKDFKDTFGEAVPPRPEKTPTAAQQQYPNAPGVRVRGTVPSSGWKFERVD